MADNSDNNEGGGCPGKERDVMQLGPEIGNGYHPYIRHRPDHSFETGLIKSRAPGSDEAMPPCDGIVQLKAAERGVFDVETLYERPQMMPRADVAAAPRSGPALVANDSFRSGWDRIFGTKTAVGQA